MRKQMKCEMLQGSAVFVGQVHRNKMSNWMELRKLLEQGPDGEQKSYPHEEFLIFHVESGYYSNLRRGSEVLFAWGAGFLVLASVFWGVRVLRRKWNTWMRTPPISYESGKLVIEADALKHFDDKIPLAQIICLERTTINGLQYTWQTDQGLQSAIAYFFQEFWSWSLSLPASRLLRFQRDLGRLASRKRAELLRGQWTKAADDFRTEECPYCRSEIVCADFPDSSHLYCAYCDTVITRRAAGRRGPKIENELRLCQSCCLYSRPRKFIIVHQIFLVFYTRWWRQDAYCCNVCIQKQALDAFFFDLLTVVPAIYGSFVLWRAYLGGSALCPSFWGLDTGNAHVRAGQYQQALESYDKIIHRLGNAPGVSYNAGIASLKANDPDAARKYFTQALASCPNYLPAREMLEK